MAIAMPLDELVPAIHQRVHGGPRREQVEVGEIAQAPTRQFQQEQILDAKRSELEIGDRSEHWRGRNVTDQDLPPHILAGGHVAPKPRAMA
jgi:hypothetical protein